MYKEWVRIRFHKLSSERHALEIVRDDGTSERIECETRSFLLHDLLHYAVETEAGLGTGFWGNKARGTDQTDNAVEQVVGTLTGAAKGAPPSTVMSALHRYEETGGITLPDWLTEPFIAAVQERMRRLLGHWNATAYGDVMELAWPTT